eukprot:1167844-Rhodomonas_salina.3
MCDRRLTRAGLGVQVSLTPPREFSLEEMIPYMMQDEMVEVTPTTMRLRKQVLSSARFSLALSEVAGAGGCVLSRPWRTCGLLLMAMVMMMMLTLTWCGVVQILDSNLRKRATTTKKK